MKLEKKKKILITIASLRLGGGAERIASILGTELYEREYDVHFLTFYDRKQKYDFEGKYSSLHEKDSKNVIVKMWKLVHRAYKIAQYCKKHKIDTSIGFMEEANFPLSLSKYFGNRSKTLISEHVNPNVRTKTEQKLIKIFYPKGLTVSVSKKIESTLNKKFKLKNTDTIYNMQDVKSNIEKSKERIAEKHKKFFEDNKTVITIGRMAEQKAHWNLIRSFSEVVKKEPKAKLIILGEGELRPKLEELIVKENLQNNIHLPGNVNNVFPYLKKADLFVLNSLWEGFGIVITEAMSLKLPVISTDCNMGPREILEPELNITEKITCPYTGKYGTLIKTPPRKQIWESTKKKELIEEEQQMATEILKQLKSKSAKNEKLLQRAYDFDKKTIIKEWEKIL